MNVYYYPVLGKTACASDRPGCASPTQVYVQFSVPDQVSHGSIDTASQDWYQPVHEPGNILSYPWSLSQMQQRFKDTLVPLTPSQPDCKATDTSTSSQSASWSTGQTAGNSVGSTNAFSDDLSINVSGGAGIDGVDSITASAGLDVKASTSLNTQNVTTASLLASYGIKAAKPVFTDIEDCCQYLFGSIILAQKSLHTPFQKIPVPDPDGKPVSIEQTGPLFAEFVTDPIPGNGNSPNQSCPNNGLNDDWWSGRYTQPDVAVNHPERWAGGGYTTTFNQADRNGSISPADQPFYHMKGLFITQAGNDDTGPSLSTAAVGDSLTVTARIYNLSLVDTNSGQNANSRVNTRIFGQLYCKTGNATEGSCLAPGAVVCQAEHLCGSGFPIGSTVLSSIPGFKSVAGKANWTTVSVPFDTASYSLPNLSNANLVFWVVTWLDNPQGQLVPEMPGHGLTAIPNWADIHQITDVPIEDYSNNVGLFGANSPFHIAPKAQPGATPGELGAIRQVQVLASPALQLGQRDKITALISTDKGAVNSLSVAYYDGNPSSGGRLLDVQQVHHIDADSTYSHRTFFTPRSCGVHTIYVESYGPGQPALLSQGFASKVSIDVFSSLRSLTQMTTAANLPNEFTQPMIRQLQYAQTFLHQYRQAEAKQALSLFIRTANAAGRRPELANRIPELVDQANVLSQCGRQ